MNGPGWPINGSIRRHSVMKTSNWPHFVCASNWLRGHHLRLVLSDSGDLVPVLDDPVVACDDHPASARHLGYPVHVEYGGGGDRAGWPVPLVDQSPWVTGVRHIVAQAGEDLPESGKIGVDIDAGLRGPGSLTRRHAGPARNCGPTALRPGLGRSLQRPRQRMPRHRAPLQWPQWRFRQPQACQSGPAG